MRIRKAWATAGGAVSQGSAVAMPDVVLNDCNRGRLDQWCRDQGVDNNARLLFLSLPDEHREQVRSMGKVQDARNPSALLCNRIRQVFPGFIQFDMAATEERNELRRNTMVQFPSLPRPRILFVVVRGEPYRVGQRTEHATELASGVFCQNMKLLLSNFIEPLEADGFTPKVFADLRIGDRDGAEAEHALNSVFGRRILEARIQKELFGLDQVSSVISTFDSMQHCMRQRYKNEDVIGAYFVRADMALKRKGFHTWPKEKLCFPWNTTCGGVKECVNDVLFYIPCPLFETLRSSMQRPNIKQNLHWLGEIPELQKHIWSMYPFVHPSNPQICGNPYYEFSCRESAKVNYGKFRHAELEATKDDSPNYAFVKTLTLQAKRLEWNRHVKEVMLMAMIEGVDFIFPVDFQTAWNKRYPDDCVEWFTPHNDLIKSLELVPEVERFKYQRQNAFRWRDPAQFGWKDSPACSICPAVAYHVYARIADNRPFYCCSTCGQVICVMCVTKVPKFSWTCAACLPQTLEIPQGRKIPPWRQCEAQRHEEEAQQGTGASSSTSAPKRLRDH